MTYNCFINPFGPHGPFHGFYVGSSSPTALVATMPYQRMRSNEQQSRTHDATCVVGRRMARKVCAAGCPNIASPGHGMSGMQTPSLRTATPRFRRSLKRASIKETPKHCDPSLHVTSKRNAQSTSIAVRSACHAPAPSSLKLRYWTFPECGMIVLTQPAAYRRRTSHAKTCTYASPPPTSAISRLVSDKEGGRPSTWSLISPESPEKQTAFSKLGGRRVSSKVFA